MAIEMSSNAFTRDTRIPAKYTGEGANISPPLAWNNVPAEAKELALLCDDPNAPRAEPWTHWVVTNIPAAAAGIPEGGPLPKGALSGTNDFGNSGYGGPMPPRGHGIHHYYFRLFALDIVLPTRSPMTRSDLLRLTKGHVIDEGELVGLYERS